MSCVCGEGAGGGWSHLSSQLLWRLPPNPRTALPPYPPHTVPSPHPSAHATRPGGVAPAARPPLYSNLFLSIARAVNYYLFRLPSVLSDFPVSLSVSPPCTSGVKINQTTAGVRLASSTTKQRDGAAACLPSSARRGFPQNVTLAAHTCVDRANVKISTPQKCWLLIFMARCS